jgi:hypothetical protein
LRREVEDLEGYLICLEGRGDTVFEYLYEVVYEVASNVIIVLLCISVILNIVLYAKVVSLNRTLRNVDRGVELTKEELIQIRKRLEKLKGTLEEDQIRITDNH